MKKVEHVQVSASLVKGLVETTNSEQQEAMLSDLTRLLSCGPMKNRIKPFITWFPETQDAQERLRQFAVVTLTERLSYWQFYRSQLKETSLANYLNIGELLPIVTTGNNCFFVTTVKEIGDEESPAAKPYVRNLSLAGDGDFDHGLAENKIKASVLLDPEYGTNHHPVISLSEIGITVDQVQKLLQATNHYFEVISSLFDKNLGRQVAEAYLPEAVLRASNNPMSIIFSLFKYYGDFDKADTAYEGFVERFNSNISDDEWKLLFNYLDEMIGELQMLVKTAYAHT